MSLTHFLPTIRHFCTSHQVAVCAINLDKRILSEENEITLEHTIFCYQVLIVGLMIFIIALVWVLNGRKGDTESIDVYDSGDDSSGDETDDLLVDGSEIVS